MLTHTPLRFLQLCLLPGLLLFSACEEDAKPDPSLLMRMEPMGPAGAGEKDSLKISCRLAQALANFAPEQALPHLQNHMHYVVTHRHARIQPDLARKQARCRHRSAEGIISKSTTPPAPSVFVSPATPARTLTIIK